VQPALLLPPAGSFRDFQEPGHWLNFEEIERLVGAFGGLGVSRVRITGGALAPVLEDLRRLENNFGDRLAIIGVPRAKFDDGKKGARAATSSFAPAASGRRGCRPAFPRGEKGMPAERACRAWACAPGPSRTRVDLHAD
jgi:hypothetical protein